CRPMARGQQFREVRGEGPAAAPAGLPRFLRGTWWRQRVRATIVALQSFLPRRPICSPRVTPGPGRQRGEVMGELPAQPDQTAGLNRLPLAALILAPDGSAIAVNEAWAELAGVSGAASRGGG